MWALASVVLLAEPSPGASGVDLRWELGAPEGCDARAFSDQLSALLGDLPAIEAPLPVSVRLSSDRGGGWRLDLEVGRGAPATRRRFEAERCDTVVEAAALVVAMQIDPTVLDRVGDEPQTAAPAPPVPADPAPALAPEPAPTPVRRPGALRPGVSVGILGGLAALSLPGLTGRIGAGARITGRRFEVGVGARHRFETRAGSATGGDAGGRFSLWAGEVVVCGVPVRGIVEFPQCGAVEVGGVVARGYGVAEPRESREAWLAFGLSSGVRVVPRPWLALGPLLDARLVAVRDRYHLEGRGSVHRLGPIELQALLGLEFRPLGRPG
jgi:hypothetical protein